MIAYQIRQSFKPGEITPEEANAIGYELAKRFTKGDYAFIVATHTDKAHIHNHIIFNSTNISGTKKFRNFFLSSLVVRHLSDTLCLEHGLSVIKPKQYRDQEKRTDYPKRASYRDAIRDAIDRAIARNPKDFEELLRLLEEEEYQIKRGQNPAIKRKDQKRFIRFKSLGEGYRPDDLEKIISGEMERDPEIRKKNAKPEKKVDMLIDIQAKLAQGKGAGYERWAKVFNVKQVAKALLFLEEHDIRDLDSLNQRAKEAADHFNELSTTIKSAEKRMAEISVLKTHILNYAKTKDVYVAYRKAGYSKAFFEAHREEITLHKAAKQAFSELGEAYVIFICRFDKFGKGEPLYHVDRQILETQGSFDDGSRIIYVNGLYKGDDAVGRLMHDFGCSDAGDIYYKPLSDSVRHFKDDVKGRDNMGDIVEEFAKEYAQEYGKLVREESLAEGRAEGRADMIKNLMNSLKCNLEDALNTLNIHGEEREAMIRRING